MDLVLCHLCSASLPVDYDVVLGRKCSEGGLTTFWVYNPPLSPAEPQSTPVSCSNFHNTMRWALIQRPEPPTALGCCWVRSQMLTALRLSSTVRKGPAAGRSLLATETFPYRRGCELCKYLLYKSVMWLGRKTKKPLKILLQTWPLYSSVSSKKWS